MVSLITNSRITEISAEQKNPLLWEIKCERKKCGKKPQKDKKQKIKVFPLIDFPLIQPHNPAPFPICHDLCC